MRTTIVQHEGGREGGRERTYLALLHVERDLVEVTVLVPGARIQDAMPVDHAPFDVGRVDGNRRRVQGVGDRVAEAPPRGGREGGRKGRREG